MNAIVVANSAKSVEYRQGGTPGPVGIIFSDSGWSQGSSYPSRTALFHNGSTYRSIRTHTADLDNEPGLGAGWETYWRVLAEGFEVGIVGGAQPFSQELSDISALAANDDDVLQRKAGAWEHRSPSQLKVDLGLNLVNNTSDADKPVSTAQGTAIAAAQTAAQNFATAADAALNTALTTYADNAADAAQAAAEGFATAADATLNASLTAYADTKAPYVATKTLLKNTVLVNGVMYDKSTGDIFLPLPKTDMYDTDLGVSYNAIAAVDGESNIRISLYDANKAWVRDKFLYKHRNMAAGWFDMIGDGSVSGADMYTRMGYSWEVMKLIQRSLEFPGGFFETGGQVNLPYRQGSVVSLLAVHAGIIAQPDTIFATNAPNGADVFQINGLSHFFIRGNPTLKSTITGGSPTQGSNGISITNGGEELDFEVTGLNLPTLDTGSGTDGGKVCSVQPGSTSLEVGRINAKVFAKGCAYAGSCDLTPTNMLTKKMRVTMEIHAEDCYRWGVVSNASPSGVISDDHVDGIVYYGSSLNCQQDLVLGRCFGGRFEVHLKSTKTAAQKRLMPDGSTPWVASTPEVDRKSVV